MLVRWADRNDPAVRARSTAIWQRVNAVPQTPAGGPAAGQAARGPVGTVTIGETTTRGGTVAKALQENAGTHGTIDVTVRIDAAGAISVMDESHTGLPPGLVSCIITRVQAASFAPPQGGIATIILPITFDAR